MLSEVDDMNMQIFKLVKNQDWTISRIQVRYYWKKWRQILLAVLLTVINVGLVIYKVVNFFG